MAVTLLGSAVIGGGAAHAAEPQAPAPLVQQVTEGAEAPAGEHVYVPVPAGDPAPNNTLAAAPSPASSSTTTLTMVAPTTSTTTSAAQVSHAPSRPDSSGASPIAKARVAAEIYVVRAGDNLWTIAAPRSPSTETPPKPGSDSGRSGRTGSRSSRPTKVAFLRATRTSSVPVSNWSCRLSRASSRLASADVRRLSSLKG